MRSMATVAATVGAMVAAFAPRPVKTAELELAAAQLGIDANQVRVALSRLRSQGKIASESRGVYRLSESVQLEQTALGPWRERLDRVADAWDGDHFVALTSWLPKSDRKAARNRRRALTRLGFREHHPGVAIRPANLHLSLEDMTELLQRLGFDAGGDVLRAAELSFDPRGHWGESVDYRSRARELEDGLEALRKDGSVDAAVTAFQVANERIRDCVRDPLLPHEWVDAAGRARFWQALIEYDAFGRTLWKRNVWDRLSVSPSGSSGAQKESARGA